MRIFELSKIKSQQRAEIHFMIDAINFNEVRNVIMKLCGRVEIFSDKHMASHIFHSLTIMLRLGKYGGIHICHGMGLYDFKCKWVHAPHKIEVISSCFGLEEDGFSELYMIGERLQPSM